MLDILRDWFEQIRKARTFPIVIIYCILIFILVNRLFYLQIVDGATYAEEGDTTRTVERDIKGTRGNIYDCNGRLLAYNELAYSVTIESSDELKTNAEKNDMIYKLLQLLKKCGCDVDVDFYIELNKKGEFVFNVEDTALLNFKREVYCVKSKNDLTKDMLNATAKDVFEFLRDTEGTGENHFRIDDKYTDEEALEIMAVRYALFLNRLQAYMPITIASNIDEKTRVAVEENSADLPGVEVTTDTYRKYNDSYYFSHIIGYTGTTSAEEITELDEKYLKLNYSKKEIKELRKKQKEEEETYITYTSEDQVGKTGIESEYESYLHGAKGHKTLKVSKSGKELEETKLVQAAAGNDLYLTIDAKLQKACYDMLEKVLSHILLANMAPGKNRGTKGTASDGIKIAEYDVYFALINNNVIDITSLNDKTASDMEKSVYQKFKSKRKSVLSRMKSVLAVNSSTTSKDLNKEYQAYQSCISTYLSDQGILLTDEIDDTDSKYKAYKNGKISLSEFLQYAIANKWVDLSVLEVGDDYYSSSELYEQLLDYIMENIKSDKAFSKKIYFYMIENGSLSGRELCVILFEQGVISYDENKVAALTNGTISSYTFIRDQIKNLNITPAMLALEPCSGSVIVTDPKTGNVKACVSYPGYDTNKYANKIDTKYYYQLYEDLSYPTLYRAVQQRTAPGSTYKPLVSIAALTEGYVSVGTKYNCSGTFTDIARRPRCWLHSGHGQLNVSGAIANSCNVFFYHVGYMMSDGATNHSKGLKTIQKYAEMFGFDATSGLSEAEYSPIIANGNIAQSDAVTAAIGQSTNCNTPSQIARYATTLANKTTCYDLNQVGKIKNADGKTILKKKATVHNTINLSSTTWNAVYNGMYGVVNGEASSIDQYFTSLKKEDGVEVAGKTGTAQESKLKPNHGLFISFAPYNNPEYCVTAVIPNGFTSSNAAEVASNVYRYLFASSSAEKKQVVKNAGALITSSGGSTD